MTSDALVRGRAAFQRDAWADACTAFMMADRDAPLEPEDLERLGTAACLVGEDDAGVEAWTRAHAGFRARGNLVCASRMAFWLAFVLLDRPGRTAEAAGWVARAKRLIEECGQDCVEQGLLLSLAAVQRAAQGDTAGAVSAFEEALAVGARFRDPSVTALARHGLARGLLRVNRRAEGFALLDEVMISVTTGEVLPLVAGVIYCSVISACYDVFDLRRAQEWTAALAGWCSAHPDMMAFRGQCLVRRSELLQLHGAWEEALAEARRAGGAPGDPPGLAAAGAWYQQGELCRLRGKFAEAEEAFRRASHAGRKPYPGFALLRLAQGQTDAAEAAVQRMLQDAREPRVRGRLLGPAVEIMLALQQSGHARAAADELDGIAAALDAPLLRAHAAQSAGAVALAEGEIDFALERLREAWTLWQELGAPYEVARVRVSMGMAYRAAGDEEGAQLEFEAALEVFESLGAAPDALRVAALVAPRRPLSRALTGREIEVLRLVATGRTNRAIAADLRISEKTVARHLSNIFTKLDLPSRAAATAYAYEHKLV